ncbi:DUF2807 domain-containing protein [Bacteroidia bacterium]|nr:DUF2807 domain-containing protein [Bacteroidia bacterium]
MKKVSLISMMSIFMVLTAWSQRTVETNLKEFTSINASGVFDIVLTQGNSESLSIEADEELIPYVKYDVSAGVLKLWLKKNELKNIKKPKAFVTLKELNSLNLSGACSVNGTGVFPSKKCKIDCGGATKVNIQVKTGELLIDLSGASNLQVGVQDAKNVSLDASGASKTNISATSGIKKMNVDASGSSNVKLSGNAESLVIGVSGAGKVDAEQFGANEADITATGASRVKVGVIKGLKADASGASRIQYNKLSIIGDINTSGAAKVQAF